MSKQEKSIRLCFLSTLVISSFLLSTDIYANESEQAVDKSISVSGQVVQISVDKIKIQKGEQKRANAFDEMGKDPHSAFNEDEMAYRPKILEEEFIINEQTEFSNFIKTTELELNDPVEIKYKDQDGQKIAVQVLKEKEEL